MKWPLARFWPKRRPSHIAAFRMKLGDDAQVDANVPLGAFIGIGINAIQWANVEHMLDLLIFWHSATRYGDERKDHPRNLSYKLDYLKRHMERDESLSTEDRDAIREMRLALAEMSERRHDFTHSFALISARASSWGFSRLRYEGKHLRMADKRYGLEDIANLTKDITGQIDQMSPLVKRLCEDWLKANRSLFVSSGGENPRP